MKIISYKYFGISYIKLNYVRYKYFDLACISKYMISFTKVYWLKNIFDTNFIFFIYLILKIKLNDCCCWDLSNEILEFLGEKNQLVTFLSLWHKKLLEGYNLNFRNLSTIKINFKHVLKPAFVKYFNQQNSGLK